MSVDTYKPAVAYAAIAAGAAIVNDVSGLRDPELADVCAGTGAGLVLMHTRAAPKEKLLDPTLDGLVGADVKRFLRELISVAMAHGVAFDQLMLDPGPDFGKTPAQTVEVLRELSDLHALERPLLLAVSRKDFVGAITQRPHASACRNARGGRPRGRRRRSRVARPRRGRGGATSGRTAALAGRRLGFGAEAGGGAAPRASDEPYPARLDEN